MQTETTIQWKRCEHITPPQGILLWTKIEDKDGTRNKEVLIFDRGLWWMKDRSMYVYYTPTHWAFLDYETESFLKSGETF
jgi:hypothetical protein